jgi:hypothetical protein
LLLHQLLSTQSSTLQPLADTASWLLCSALLGLSRRTLDKQWISRNKKWIRTNNDLVSKRLGYEESKDSIELADINREP